MLLAGLPLVTAPGSTFDTVVARVEEIGLAILCASIVSHVAFPVHVGTALLGRIDAWMARAQALLAATATAKPDQARNRAGPPPYIVICYRQVFDRAVVGNP